MRCDAIGVDYTRRVFATVPPPSQRLLVFARLPEPGNDHVHHQLLANIATSTPDLEIEVMWPPTEGANGERLRRAFGAHATAMQTGEGLGDRLAMAFSERFFFHRTEQIVVIDADHAQLTRELIDHAFALLESVEYILGPANGSYSLFGCRALSFDPSVFEDIDWNTPAVLRQTLDRIANLKRTVAVLPEQGTS